MTSRRMGNSTENAMGRHYYQRLTPDNAVLLLIDHQVGLFAGVKDIDPVLLKNNVLGLARAAKVLKVPTVLTCTMPDGMWGPTIPELNELFPDVENINRTVVNALDDSRVMAAIKRTGRKKLIIAGISTAVCLVFPAISAVAAGYDAYAVMDASGAFTQLQQLTAIARMSQAGVIVCDYNSIIIEMLADNAHPLAAAVYATLSNSPGMFMGTLYQALKTPSSAYKPTLDREA